MEDQPETRSLPGPLLLVTLAMQWGPPVAVGGPHCGTAFSVALLQMPRGCTTQHTRPWAQKGRPGIAHSPE